jgi:hypothetical protein
MQNPLAAFLVLRLLAEPNSEIAEAAEVACAPLRDALIACGVAGRTDAGRRPATHRSWLPRLPDLSRASRPPPRTLNTPSLRRPPTGSGQSGQDRQIRLCRRSGRISTSRAPTG